MKIAYGSDLHLEFDPLLPRNPLPIKNTENADVLILAGDVMLAAGLTSIPEMFFSNISQEFPIVLYVMGNHEHYHGNFNTTKEILVNFLSRYSNIMLVDNECVVLEDTAFFGGTLWTDLKKRDPFIMYHVVNCMNDFHCIKQGKGKFTALQTVIEHDNTLDALKTALAETKASKMVVVTHHAPSSKSSHERFAGDDTNYAYFSNLEEFILDNGIIKAWIHGHTHDPYDYMIGDTRILCNPRGYVGIQDSAKNWQVKYVEV